MNVAKQIVCSKFRLSVESGFQARLAIRYILFIMHM